MNMQAVCDDQHMDNGSDCKCASVVFSLYVVHTRNL